MVLYLPIKGTGSAGRLEGSTKGGGPLGPRLGVPRQCQFANGRWAERGGQEGGVSRHGGRERCYGGQGGKAGVTGRGAGSVGRGSPVDTMSVKARSKAVGGTERGGAVRQLARRRWVLGVVASGRGARACPERWPGMPAAIHGDARGMSFPFFVTSRAGLRAALLSLDSHSHFLDPHLSSTLISHLRG